MHTLIPIRSANLGNARMEGYNLNLIDNGDHAMKTIPLADGANMANDNAKKVLIDETK